MSIQSNYERLCKVQSDIFEHLPTLKSLSLDKEVIELGVREVVSTWAFLAGKPKSLMSYDIYRSNNISQVEIEAASEGIPFSFTMESSLEAVMPECDILFIDTWHNYHHLKMELDKLHAIARERIILHDTVTFAHRSEKMTNGRKPLDLDVPEGLGLWDALEEFLSVHNEWKIEKHFDNNNGLTVLVREGIPGKEY